MEKELLDLAKEKVKIMVNYGSNGLAIAIQKATMAAQKNLMHFDRFGMNFELKLSDNRTISSDLNHSFHSTNLIMKSAYPGYGIVANNHLHELFRLIGFSVTK